MNVLLGRRGHKYGYTPVFIAYGILPLVALSLVLFALGRLRPLPEFQTLEEKPKKFVVKGTEVYAKSRV